MTHLESTEAYYKHYRHLLKRVREDLEALRAIGSDFAIFPSAQYAAKAIREYFKSVEPDKLTCSEHEIHWVGIDDKCRTAIAKAEE